MSQLCSCWNEISTGLQLNRCSNRLHLLQIRCKPFGYIIAFHVRLQIFQHVNAVYCGRCTAGRVQFILKVWLGLKQIRIHKREWLTCLFCLPTKPLILPSIFDRPSFIFINVLCSFSSKPTEPDVQSIKINPVQRFGYSNPNRASMLAPAPSPKPITDGMLQKKNTVTHSNNTPSLGQLKN